MGGFGAKLRRGDVEGLIREHSDLLLAGLIVAIVGMMIVPLPTLLIDLLIALNLTIAVVLLMVAIYVPDALRITTFPTLLLLTTLFRLALNVSSTRLILLQADAGDIIRSFGEFVVRGNFVVGAIIFLVLTLIQYIVISKGSERVAEVAARFTLDAMPGRQLAIDADLRAGHLDQEEARRRRSALQRESQLFGSMDGAMKFVKGDAIAGIVIIVITIVGGLIIGVVQRGLSLNEALEVYSLLTIGDGLVSQIPALIISTAAGLIVTRVASEEEGTNLGAEIGRQLIAQPKAIAVAAVVLGLLAIVPGLPTLPFLTLAALAGTVAWALFRARARTHTAHALRPHGRAAHATAHLDGDALGDEKLATPGVPPIVVELGDALADACQLDNGTTGTTGTTGRLVGEVIPELRRTLYAELGVHLPPVRVRRAGVPGGLYRLALSEIPVVEGLLPTDRRLALARPDRIALLGAAATPARHPLTGAPAAWIHLNDTSAVERAGIPLLDAVDTLGAALHAALRRYAFELIGIQQAHALLESVEATHPALVREVVPKIVSLQLLADVLRRLVEEQVSIRDLPAVLGALADRARTEKDPLLLTEQVRTSLRRQLTFQHARGQASLSVYLLSPMIEEAIRDAITRTRAGSFLALEPELARDILAAVRTTLAQRADDAPPAILLTHAELRRFTKRLLDAEQPGLTVLSIQELAPELTLQPIGHISVG